MGDSISQTISFTNGDKGVVFYTQPIFCQHQLTKGDRSENIPHPTLTKGGKRLSAFSLIELSILLIIMGLLVAGVTGGQSLIQSAKTRAIINEATGYKRAVNIFYAKNGRLPGDPDGTGRMGKMSGNYLDDSGDHYDYIAERKEPWIEMASDGIVEYDSDTSVSVHGKESKYMKNVIYQFYFYEDYDASATYIYDGEYDDGLLNANVMELNARYTGYIPTSIVVGIEEKIDDKSLITGNVRINYEGYFTYIPEIEDDWLRVLDYYGDGGIEKYKDLANAKNGACDVVLFKLDNL